jgi:SMC interacting uncharacterized protein involved in chromosome segregation
MDTHLDRLDCVQEEFHQAFNCQMEDVEKDVQVVKGDIDDVKIRMDFLHHNISDSNNSINTLNIWRDWADDHLEGLAQSIQSNAKVASSMLKASILEAQQVERELRPMVEGWFGKLGRCNTIIDKKIIRLEEELDKVMAFVGEKIQSRMEDLSSKFSEALEVEGRHYGVLARDVKLLKSQLETSQATNILLSNLVTSLQGRVAKLEDAVMENSEEDAEGEVLSSLSSSDMEPVENMVMIPVPALSVPYMLVPVKFIPPSVCSSPSPYVQDVEDDPLHDGVLEYWVDPDV